MNFFNIEAEQGLLGCILLRNEALHAVGDVLSADHFYDPVHARIYGLCQSRIAKGHLADPVALRSLLDGDEGLKQLGGPAYLARMAGASPPAAAIRGYAKIIIEDAARRALHGAGQEVATALSVGGDPHEIKMGLLRALQALPEGVGDESSYSLMQAMVGAADEAVAAFQGKRSFLRTGISALDRVIRGLAPGDLCLLAGATSMGKTSVALEITGNVARSGTGVAFVSLEMSKEQLATRMASAVSRVPYAQLRDPSDMQEDDFRRWIEATKPTGELPVRIIPRHIRDVAAIHAAAMRVAMETGNLGLVVVDYAQLVRAQGRTRMEQMIEVSIGLKQMAGMLGLPVVALCQLSRDIGTRDDKRPQLSDIKETGQFENDADQVVFCHREGYWLERQGPKQDRSGKVTDEARADWQADCAAVKNKLELIVRKNRHGRLATAEVGFHDATMRFWDMKDGLDNAHV